ncbi:MAG: DNA methyltransferase [Kiritimatiellae bacterium]|nr:DNA methyltransferase [Kiritimatiellia bacterium]
MAENRQLTNAKSAKNDEFYTQYADIQKEVNAYLDFNPDTFRGKSVLLPCDDPEWSKFTRFFAENFERLGLKKLISTSYAAASKKIGMGAKKWGDWYQPSLFESESPQFDAEKTGVRGKIFVLDHDTNANGRIDLDDLEWHYLEGDGDFRSEEVCRLRDEADVIVTNPPFSLFREFLAWILGECKSECKIENGKCKIEAATKNTKDTKKFLIIGNMNTVNTKDVFPHVVSGQLWLGATGNGSDMVFAVPKGAYVDPKDRAKAAKLGYVGDYTRLGNSCWFTNMEHGRRHQPLQLMTMADNLRYSRHREIKEHGYRRYDNYDAIEVPYSDAIPSDYDGVMGVPVTFLDKFCPEQFEIVGITKTWFGAATKTYPEQVQVDANGRRKAVTKLNDGAVLKIDEPPQGSTYYEVGGEKFIQTYPRILIRARRGK